MNIEDVNKTLVKLNLNTYYTKYVSNSIRFYLSELNNQLQNDRRIILRNILDTMNYI